MAITYQPIHEKEQIEITKDDIKNLVNKLSALYDDREQMPEEIIQLDE